MTVSKPVKIETEIEDLTTGCTYIYKGTFIEDCRKYFLSLFYGNRPHKILWINHL